MVDVRDDNKRLKWKWSGSKTLRHVEQQEWWRGTRSMPSSVSRWTANARPQESRTCL